MIHNAISAVIISAVISPGGAGGAEYQEASPPEVKPVKAEILKSGKATVPKGAPTAVRAIIEAGNQIVGKPYLYGGGHGSFKSRGYDCSGSVSYALHGGGLLKNPLSSGPLMSWGRPGRGQWVTVYANPGHAYMEVAGVRLDTSRSGDPGGGDGPRWRKPLKKSSGYKARHPGGL